MMVSLLEANAMIHKETPPKIYCNYLYADNHIHTHAHVSPSLSVGLSVDHNIICNS